MPFKHTDTLCANRWFPEYTETFWAPTPSYFSRFFSLCHFPSRNEQISFDGMEFNGSIIFIQFSLCQRRRFQHINIIITVATAQKKIKEKKKHGEKPVEKTLKFNEFRFWKRKTLQRNLHWNYCRINRTPRMRTHINITSASVTGTGKPAFTNLNCYFLFSARSLRRTEQIRGVRWRRGGWRRNENESKIIMRQKQQQLQEHHTKLQRKKSRTLRVKREWNRKCTYILPGTATDISQSENGLSLSFTLMRSIVRLQPPDCQYICIAGMSRSLSLPHIHTYGHTPLPNVSTLLGADYCCK